MDRRRGTLVSIWLVIAAISSGAWATRALAQTDERRRPSCVTMQGDPCCIPGQGPDDEQGADDDCPPATRRHRAAGDGRDRPADGVRASNDEDSEGDREGDAGRGGADDPDGDDDGNDTGASSPRRGFGRGSGSARRGASGAQGSATPGGASTGGTPGGAPTGGTTGGSPAGSGAPGVAAGGATVAAPGLSTVSSPGVPAPAVAASGTTATAGSASTAAGGAAPAGRPNRSLANTGADLATPLSLALTLLMAGTTLRRATRPRPPRRLATPGSGRLRRPPSPAAPPRWSYVDHSSAARAIEKF